MLNVQNLSVSFGEREVLSNISISLREGGRLAVLGSNGSGKSTLAHCLAGLIPGFMHADAKSSTLTIPKATLLMQNPSNQFFGLTVGDEIPKHMAERFFPDGISERLVFELSEGEKQKVNLLSNLSCKPGLLLLDEPLELLDPYEKARFVKLLSECDAPSVVWFDKDERHVSHFRRKLWLSKKHGFDLPKRIPRQLGAKVLDANFSVKRGAAELKGIQFSLRKGEKAALIGRNGSGKTTVLHSLASLVKRNGAVNSKMRFSLAFQNPVAGFGANTVKEEITNPVYADALGLSALAEQYPFHLSKGQQKLLSLACLNPDTIQLVDEPTTWLDSSNRASAMNLIANSSETMVIATHDEAVAKLCDRIFMVEGGVGECSSTKAGQFFRARPNSSN